MSRPRRTASPGRDPFAMCWSVALSSLALVALLASPARADGPPENGDQRSLHVQATVGWYGALTGPSPHGPALELEIFPGHALGAWGLGFYYRGFERVGHGSFALGLAYEVGASRPGLQMGMHADLGYESTRSMPLVGGGLRVQLGVAGPLVVASDAIAHVFIDGVDSRLALAFVLGVGLAR